MGRDKNNAALHNRYMCCLKSLHYAPDPFTLTSLSTYLIVASPTKNAGSPWGAGASKSTAVFHWARCHRIAQQSWVTAFYPLQFAPAAWRLLPTRLPTLPRSCSGVQSSWSYCNACTASDNRINDKINSSHPFPSCKADASLRYQLKTMLLRLRFNVVPGS
jgi:hypothetical protein